MLSGKIFKFSSSVSIRLTFWSILTFSICLTAVLSAFYYIVENNVLKAIDSSITYELEEAQALYKLKGFDPLPKHIIEEAEEFDSSKSFFRIIDASGLVIATSDARHWKNLPAVIKLHPQNIQRRNFVLYQSNGEKDHIRIISVPLDNNLYIEGGLRFNHEFHLLQLYSYILPITGLVIILLATSAIYITARSTMKRVDAMTTLANSISASHLNFRLPEWPYDDELNRLSKTFNKLLSRIETLVKGMKHVTDDIAHDLKMPITRMRSRAELALNNEKGAELVIEESANTIEECDHLLNMLNSMLDISEAEAQLISLKIEPLNIDYLLSTAIELFEPLAEQKSITLDYISSGSLNIEGDIAKLQRAFSNLIDNAIKYTPTNGNVTISLTQKGDDVIVIIRDSGIGISEEQQSLIFERFYRADISRSGDGSGLGLTLSKALIEAHNGQILVESNLGLGTTFSIHLPGF